MKLVVTNNNLTDDIEKTITVSGIDATSYDGIPGWNTLYFEDFTTSGDWYEGSGVV